MGKLWFNCETGGLDPARHPLLEIAGLIEIDGVIVDDFDFRVQPDFKKDDISLATMELFGIKVDDLKDGMAPRKVQSELMRMWGKYVDKFDKGDKLTPAGYNIQFDIDFLSAFFRKTGMKFLFSYITHAGLDVLALVRYLSAIGRIPVLEDHKLQTVCKDFGIQLDDAHTAAADIKATWQLAGLLRTEFIKEL
jgi:DNA polymerase III alpha subunit (gram-positive type)